MNTLLAMFEDPSISNFTLEDKKDVTRACIEYMFKLITVAQFKNKVGAYNLPNDVWRTNAKHKGVLKIRLWLRYLTKYPTRKVAKKFEIENPHDVEVRDLFLSDTELFNTVKDLPGQVFTWKRMQRILAKLSEDLAPYIRHRVRKKLTFLKSTENDFTDFESELLIHVLAGVHAKYPRYSSYLHMANTARTIVKNMSINIIKYHTSLGRQNKYQLEDGTFSSHKVSLEALTENGAFSEMGDEFTLEDPVFEEIEIRQTIDTLANSPNKRKAFKLLMGVDAKFSAWLKNTGKTKLSDNISVQSRLIQKGDPQVYISYISDYLNVPMEKIMRFYMLMLEHLRSANNTQYA